jgi:thymidylate kinase
MKTVKRKSERRPGGRSRGGAATEPEAVLRPWHTRGGPGAVDGQTDCGGRGGWFGAVDADLAVGDLAGGRRARDGAGGIEAVDPGERGTRAGQAGEHPEHITLSLFYATDFADQLENIILPALKAGFMVLADRYIYTLMVRDLVRGMDEAWLRKLYGIALVPDAVFYLNVSSEELVQRNFAKNRTLDYWESGMDLGLSRDMFDSFLKYQGLVQEQFRRLQSTYGFTIVDGERSGTRSAPSCRPTLNRSWPGTNRRPGL